MTLIVEPNRANCRTLSHWPISTWPTQETLEPILENDRRFRAAPVSVDKYRRWFDEQKNEAKVAKGKGVYVGLRMDGRVRSSGVGVPPWERFAAELPPTDSWGGVMDGFDGRVGVDT